MIDPSATSFYLAYAAACCALGILYIRIKSSEGTSITTTEFQVFQSSFISGYVGVILCELIASATFYHTFLSMDLDLGQICRLYLATMFASTITAVIMECVELGARKDKCVLSAMLYSIAMFSVFFGGHYEMLLLGRILYGVASALQHSSFESYAVHQHSSHGFPEDWLSHMFTLLTHTMALFAALSGIIGQMAISAGRLGCITFSCVVFAIIAVYMIVAWEKDLGNPRFMLAGFMSNLSQSINTMRANRQLLYLLCVSALYESTITVFMFYWAPWIGTTLAPASSDVVIPYELIFSTMVAMSMVGNYVFQLFISNNWSSLEGTFSWVLIGTSVAYTLGGVLQTATFILPLVLIVQGCMGIYWPCIGHYRGRMILPELRSATLIIPRYVTAYEFS